MIPNNNNKESKSLWFILRSLLFFGISQEKLDTARKMLLKNIDEQLITDVTGLSLEQVQKLKTEVAGEPN